jgi:uncharacterized ferritin-like protein (DUF455 family)
MLELRQQSLNCLCIQHPAQKIDAINALASALNAGECQINTQLDLSKLSQHPNLIPGRPEKPALVSPKYVKRRAMNTPEGRAALVHALAHIEFNAINLALDAIWRFANMPEQYYKDWLKVAAEEAYHFSLLNQHLIDQGFSYGAFDAHDSLWEMATRTTEDVLARIALVPRTMEARGLDASPSLRAKFAQVGDAEVAATLDIILRDEIGHVAIGNHWFNFLCESRSLDPINTYQSLAKQYEAPTPRKPFNHSARRSAGFTEAELAWLENQP